MRISMNSISLVYANDGASPARSDQSLLCPETAALSASTLQICTRPTIRLLPWSSPLHLAAILDSYGAR